MKTTISTEKIPRRIGRRVFEPRCFLCPASATVRRIMTEGAATVNACLCGDCNRLDDQHLEMRLNRGTMAENAARYIDNRVKALTRGRSVCSYCGRDLGPCDLN